MQSTSDPHHSHQNHVKNSKTCCCDASNEKNQHIISPSVIPLSTNWGRLGVALGCAIGAEIWESLQFSPEWLTALFACIAIIIGGMATYFEGWRALFRLNLNMNTLMTIAITGAILLNQWAEAAMVLVLFEIAEHIEEISLVRSRRAIQALFELAPKEATVQITPNQWEIIPVEQVQLGTVIRVGAGERISLDGIVESGYSTVDQSPITGESLPVEKRKNDPIFAGTLNQNGMLLYRVTALYQETVLSQIIQMVEAGQMNRAPIQRLIDQFAKIYTPLIFCVALCVAIVPPLFFHQIWIEWIYKALVILVIACPCALVISTPVTIMSGLTVAARHGLLIKGGGFLEIGRKLKYIIWDKTGTLTNGTPTVTDFENWTTEHENEIIQICYSLASCSDHPISKAITMYWADKSVLVPVENFAALLGKGIQGMINNKTYYLIQPRFVEEKQLFFSYKQQQKIKSLEAEGKTIVVLMNQEKILACLAVSDTLRPEAIFVMQKLRAMHVKNLILSGDHPATVEHIAQLLGIETAKAYQLPQDKANFISQIIKQKNRDEKVGMIGDGINDAPALAHADISFAMGMNGTDITIETANVVLMDQDLRKILKFISLSQKTVQLIYQNITFALSVKLFFLVLTLMGMGSMWLAVFADTGVSLLVILNGLRLLRFSTRNE